MLSSVSPPWTTWMTGVAVAAGVAVAGGGVMEAVAVGRTVGAAGTVLPAEVLAVGCGVTTLPQAASAIRATRAIRAIARTEPRIVRMFVVHFIIQRLYHICRYTLACSSGRFDFSTV
jgi:hypothetical protein